MKEQIQQYVRTLQKLLPRHSESVGVGKHVKRDWFTILIVAILVSIVFIVVGMVRSANVSLNEAVLPNEQGVFVLPINEKQLGKVLEVYRERSAVFEADRAATPKVSIVEEDVDEAVGTSTTPVVDTSTIPVEE